MHVKIQMITLIVKPIITNDTFGFVTLQIAGDVSYRN